MRPALPPPQHAEPHLGKNTASQQGRGEVGGVFTSSHLSLFKLVPFLVVSFSPNLRLKTYYFSSQEKRTRGKKRDLCSRNCNISVLCPVSHFSDSWTSPAMPGPQVWQDHWSQSLFRVLSSPRNLQDRTRVREQEGEQGKGLESKTF